MTATAATTSTEHVEATPEPVNHLPDEQTASSNTEIKSSNMTETKLMYRQLFFYLTLIKIDCSKTFKFKVTRSKNF